MLNQRSWEKNANRVQKDWFKIWQLCDKQHKMLIGCKETAYLMTIFTMQTRTGNWDKGRCKTGKEHGKKTFLPHKSVDFTTQAGISVLVL